MSSLDPGQFAFPAFIRDFSLRAHEKAVQLFEREASAGRDPQLRGFAEQTLPMLRGHLRLARDLS